MSIIKKIKTIWKRIGNDIYYLKGKVGIGLTNPDLLLTIEDSLSTAKIVRMRNLSTGSQADIMVMNINATAASIGNHFIEFRDSGGLIGNIEGNGTGTNYITTSDIREKHNITPLNNCLDKCDSINPIEYTGKEDSTNTKNWGFSAQEIAEVFPDACIAHEGKDGTWGMDYGKMTPILFQMVKELKAEIELLKIT